MASKQDWTIWIRNPQDFPSEMAINEAIETVYKAQITYQATGYGYHVVTVHHATQATTERIALTIQAMHLHRMHETRNYSKNGWCSFEICQGRNGESIPEWVTAFEEAWICRIQDRQQQWLSRQLEYTEIFDKKIDDNGEMQLSAEEAIAAQLFFHFAEHTPSSHCGRILSIIVEHFPVADQSTGLGEQLNQILTHWLQALADQSQPSEEEATNISKELLIFVLVNLHPTWVKEVEGDQNPAPALVTSNIQLFEERSVSIKKRITEQQLRSLSDQALIRLVDWGSRHSDVPCCVLWKRQDIVVPQLSIADMFEFLSDRAITPTSVLSRKPLSRWCDQLWRIVRVQLERE
jgi:hypothetical protein